MKIKKIKHVLKNRILEFEHLLKNRQFDELLEKVKIASDEVAEKYVEKIVEEKSIQMFMSMIEAMCNG